MAIAVVIVVVLLAVGVIAVGKATSETASDLVDSANQQ